jgi:hypothetical protein
MRFYGYRLYTVFTEIVVGIVVRTINPRLFKDIPKLIN